MEYIVFGTSNAAKYFIETKPNISVAYFCDNNENKWGTIFFGKEVISPARLSLIYDPLKYAVVIASMYVPEIGLQLMKMGIEHFQYFKIQTIEGEGFSKEEYDVLPFLKKYSDEYGHFKWNEVPFDNAANLQYKREITVVIPTYKRPQLVKQAITYYGSISNEELGVRLLILDASPEVIQAEIADFVKDMPQDRVCLRTFAEDASFCFRLFTGIQLVETEYCAICGDDDFLFYEGLEDSIDFLENNGEFFAAQGNNYLFSQRLANFWYDRLASPQKSITGDKIDMRVRQWNHFCEVYIYMAYRTSELQKFYAGLAEKYELMDHMNAHFAEYLYYFLVLSWGKIGATNSKWGFREASKLNTYLNSPVIYDTILDGTFQKNLDIAWEVYHYIFPNVSKENFLKMTQHMIFTVILGKKRNDNALDADTVRREFENSNVGFWSSYVGDRKKKNKESIKK